MFRFFYKIFIKPVLFLFDAEFVHENMLGFGELVGGLNPDARSGPRQNRRGIWFLKKIFGRKYSELKQNISGIDFESPVGLAAGFDYEAKLTQILPSLGFGFQAVGTITNQAYPGNPKPRLGRLPKSKSLMVNKGFKNKGAKFISEKLKNFTFSNAIGISIGVTNTEKITTIESGIEDIIPAFKIFESGGIKNSYYELNISCPNLKVKIDFYNPENLNKLLQSVNQLGIKKPIFIKMPINIADDEALVMLKVIAENKMAGVIFGNLQKDRNNEVLKHEEVARFPVGYFSGKPTEKRSNELIKLAYQNFGKQLVIIGCGGVFSAEDAYKKIKLGASLVQLITGVIYEGPQLVSEINRDLVKLLKKDGYNNISEAVGTESRK
ncbi:MAG: dihydroorotate dehydrogenase (quinone) [Candidatus Brennerbacteria bacterium RIFOXYC1_FULL_41_11]|uniref:Dihydroorotate dehydrogenase (quinone) n=1 Tax=Candidatus Brennerbacteria bacterium RIFOXYD1_FULL_41_16 TaxID=1797529 RepID=A0A1G1XL24_9BACT|nr:MAG: dihydroorotate dehydrogenase (quinone) [Candidatus Brennerbacteria bacterium RIFOXYC1_FULL_41_11]OGY40661.1 MAG: dihydroorotate dehydrogenase (quinone) [Candidatus Brennerbacteria bacterium RIFOXYD1_FULL_41_16]